MLTLKVGDHDCSENAYIYCVRRKYWNALFRNDEFMKNMTDVSAAKLSVTSGYAYPL